MKRLQILIFIGVLLTITRSAFAQINLDLKLDRNLYLLNEPITGELQIVNMAGRDLIFGESGGMSWLDFTITDSGGHLVSPVRGSTQERPIVLTAGQSYKHKVVINRRYPLSGLGTYRVKATVQFPQINRVFETKTVTVQIVDGQPMWSQIVGVPQGYPDAGAFREYALMTYYHGARARALYFRLKDSDSGVIIRTYSLGDFLSVRQPSHALDRQNQLHVLHMTGPNSYKYTVLNIDGEPVQQRILYSKGENRPELKSDGAGGVTLVGGMSEDEAKTPYEQQEFPRLSERPPGLPSL